MTDTRTTKLLPFAAALAAVLLPLRAPAESASSHTLGDGLRLSLGTARDGGLSELVPAAPARRTARRETATSSSRGSEVGTLKMGGAIGLVLASGFTGFAVRLPLSYTVAELSPDLYFDVVGHAGLTFGSDQQIYELVPAARIRYVLAPKVAIYGDGGLGLSVIHTSYGGGYYYYYGGSDTSLGAVLRFAGGFQIPISPTAEFTVEPVGLNIYFNGNGSTFAYSLLVGMLFRI